MKNTNKKEFIGFFLEVYLFVFSGFLIGIGHNLGYLLLIGGFIFAIITGEMIRKNAIRGGVINGKEDDR